ncbi:MAG: hypothetical protein GQ532_11780 [Methylomarinum sp.]|nr:hypothetical protein [Methylomarinum sp.]
MKININNEELINKEITDAQAKSRTRHIDVADVIYQAKVAEERLIDLGVPVVHRKGATVDYVSHSGGYGGSYGGTRRSTCFQIVRGGKDWFLVAVWRGYADVDKELTLVNEEQVRKHYRVLIF